MTTNPAKPATSTANVEMSPEAQLKRREQRERQELVDSAERRHSLNEVAIAIERSKPATLLRMLNGANIWARPGSSAETQAACAEQDANIAKVQTALQAGLQQLKDALHDATDNCNYCDVLTAVETVKIDHVAYAQQLVALWTNSLSVAAKMEEELRPLQAKLDADAEAVVAEVKKDLTKIGSGIEATIAGPNYGDAAERQFNSLARLNTRSRKSLAAAHDAGTYFRAAAEDRSKARRGLQTVQDYLHGIVLKQINS